MCHLCDKTKRITEYEQLIEKMVEDDKRRLEHSKTMASGSRLITRSIYSSMKWPIKLVYPMFEARAPYAVPNNYFQNIILDEERLGNSFAHGAMRSLFFVGKRLVIFSKSVHFHDGKEFFTSYILLHLDHNEYEHMQRGNEIHISAKLEKPMKNLISGKVEKKKVMFSFVNQPVVGRIVSKEHVVASARYKEVYGRYGGARKKSASMDLEGYAITVPHFSPHPYMLQLHEKFGYESNKEFQLHVADYFREHITEL